AIDEDRHLDEVAFLITLEVIVETRIAAADRFESVVKIEDDFIERQTIDHHRAAAGIGEFDLPAATILAQLQYGTEMLVRHKDRCLDPGLLDEGDANDIGHVGRIVELIHRAVSQVHAVDHARCGRNEIEVELALETLADDLQM